MTKAKSKTSDARTKRKPGGEALRQRVTDLWYHWTDDLRNGLVDPSEGEAEGLFTNLDLLEIVSEKDFPDGRQLGKDSWREYRKALTLEKRLKQRIGSSDSRRLAKELSAYGAARELAGYRAAQLEILVADHVANQRASEAGNRVKTEKVEKRVKQLVDFVRDNSLKMLRPVAAARLPGCRDKVKQEVKAFGSVGEKQFERDMVKAFGILRSKALLPFLNSLKKADRDVSRLLRHHRGEIEREIQAAGISKPTNLKQFREAIEFALPKTRN